MLPPQNVVALHSWIVMEHLNKFDSLSFLFELVVLSNLTWVMRDYETVKESTESQKREYCTTQLVQLFDLRVLMPFNPSEQETHPGNYK